MINSIFAKSRKLVPIAFVAFTIGLLASCSSSNQFASTFSKRKYTKGHFSNPVARLKTDYKSDKANGVAASVNAQVMPDINNKIITKSTNEKSTANFTPARQNVTASTKRIADKGVSETTSISITKAPIDNQNDNVSLKEITNSPAIIQSQGSRGGDGGGGGHHYLLDCLLCLLLWLVFIILAAASVVGGSGAGLGLFAILAYLSAIAALVFFILWIISLAS